ncbi:hypothetical protein EYF80_016320 [Liparis tanakae]|uniref:Uncharacterized protein n=1 Tax=Liparis tanakae TaxID=230148 RepID=A0A4Z2I5Q2_9TELE|nr:hypothetical protein EYF80_016320 [Liparis tanakae]
MPVPTVKRPCADGPHVENSRHLNVAVSVSTESSPSACVFSFYSASRDTGSTAHKNVHAYPSKIQQKQRLEKETGLKIVEAGVSDRLWYEAMGDVSDKQAADTALQLRRRRRAAGGGLIRDSRRFHSTGSAALFWLGGRRLF